MGGGVCARGLGAHFVVNRGAYNIPHRQGRRQRPLVNNDVVDAGGFANVHDNRVTHGQGAAVADLATLGAVKRCFIQCHFDFVPGGGRLYKFAAPQNGQYTRFHVGCRRIFASVVGVGQFGLRFPQGARALGIGAGPFFLFGHGAFKSDRVHVHAAVAQNHLGQIQRESICVKQFKRHVARQSFVMQFRQFAVQQFHTVLQHVGKCVFFVADNFDNA